MFTTVAGLRDDYRACVTALDRLLRKLVEVAERLHRVIAAAVRAMQSALERMQTAEAAIETARAAMDAAEDGDARGRAEADLAVAQADLADAQVDYERASAAREEAVRRLALVERAMTIAMEARSAVFTALRGLDRHIGVEQAVAAHPGPAPLTAAYGPAVRCR